VRKRQCGIGVTFRRPDGKGGVEIKRVKVFQGETFSGLSLESQGQNLALAKARIGP
jgi:hypothetical protein